MEKKWNIQGLERLLVAGLLLPATIQAAGVAPFEIQLVDPLHPSRPQQSHPVFQTVDENGFPGEYVLQLQTEVCLEQLCNRIDTTLIWDALGAYLRMEVTPGTSLEKHDHIPFVKADYDRLDEILRDAGSILGTYPPTDFFKPSEKNPEKVDGVSAATPLALQNAVVDGAAHTTWVLWHWVNGEIAGELRALTAQRATADYLRNCLQSNDDDLVRFALRHLLKNKIQGSEYRVECFRILETGGRNECRLALRYLSEGSMDRDELLLQLVDRIGVNPGSSILIIEYFEEQGSLDSILQQQMAEQLGRLSSYDLYAVLNVLEDTKPVRRHVLNLLESDNAYVVRCAQEFLARADQ